MAGIFIWGRIAEKRHADAIKPWITYKRLLYIADACEDYRIQLGNWPNASEDLYSFRPTIKDPWSKDAWGTDILLLPYDRFLGYGKILSYGRDKKREVPVMIEI